MRSFVAVPLPEAVRVATAALAVDLAGRPGGEGVRWVRSDGYHVTLRFLGNVPVDQLPELAEAVGVAAASIKPFSLSVGPPHPFPPGQRPKIVALSLEPQQALIEIADRVEQAVVGLGFAPETKRFRAHVTLGRIRNRRFPSLDGLSSPLNAEWPVKEIVLYRSDLEREGARYTPLTRCPLGPKLSVVTAEDSP